ncbi:cell division protein FtsQ [Rhodococcus sp. OK519]|uniref:cell division protein FtsQ/DivIB n=1 Tax=Rhodococcus sp. OK519 TaxID=2135729 RepID=UPI000D4A79D7|nr:cell division protein FtsQ [Rhodococcus sp. OK519]
MLVDSAAPSDHVGRGSADRARARSLRRRVFLIGGVSAVLIVALVGTLWFSPLMSVKRVEYVGDGMLSSEEVLAQAGIQEGTPLLRVDTAAAAQRVAGIPRVAEARVRREYPSTVQVSVTERIPVVFFDSPEGTHLMDATGVDYAIEPPPFGVVRLVTPTPGRDDHATQAALGVLEALPESVRFQVSEVAAPTISSVSATLVDGRVVVWGSVDDSERKSAVLSVLLTQPGQIFDVSSPQLPTVK